MFKIFIILLYILNISLLKDLISLRIICKYLLSNNKYINYI